MRCRGNVFVSSGPSYLPPVPGGLTVFISNLLSPVWGSDRRAAEGWIHTQVYGGENRERGPGRGIKRGEDFYKTFL